MRIFVSSSFQDLQEYRAAAIRVLRQLGHEVVAMEDFVAASEVPLKVVLEKVERCELYVGVFAWRYGSVPKNGTGPGADGDPNVLGATFGSTSITHYEYLQAKAKDIDRLAFLLDERVPWPPQLVDGFSTVDPSGPKDASAIRALRAELQRTAVVSFFSNPNDLEARVSAAVTVAGMSRQVRLNLAGVVPAVVNDSLPEEGIRQTILSAGPQPALMVDLDTTWWSTRLYLTAALAERLTNVRRFVIARGGAFVGLVSTRQVLSTLATTDPALAAVSEVLYRRRTMLPDADAEIIEVFKLWSEAFAGTDPKQQEQAVKVVLTADLLRRWFGDAMLEQPVYVGDLARASVIDLLRILDYPSEFVPVVSRGPTSNAVGSIAAPPQLGKIQVVDKSALSAQLAQSYVTELMDRSRIT